MIKHFSKWLELVSLPNYSIERVAYAFLDYKISQFHVSIKKKFVSFSLYFILFGHEPKLPSSIGFHMKFVQTYEAWKICDALYHSRNVDCQIEPSLAIVHFANLCMLCRQFLKATTMLIYDQCSNGWHMRCLTPPLKEILVRKWFCFRCTSYIDLNTYSYS
jgi:hypothetical protein